MSLALLCLVLDSTNLQKNWITGNIAGLQWLSYLLQTCCDDPVIADHHAHCGQSEDHHHLWLGVLSGIPNPKKGQEVRKAN